jgi:hypothetical protein
MNWRHERASESPFFHAALTLDVGAQPNETIALADAVAVIAMAVRAHGFWPDMSLIAPRD